MRKNLHNILITNQTMQTVKFYPCTEDKFSDIPDLKFYRTDADLYYFDATGFIKKAPHPENLGVESFLKVFSYLIDAIRETNGIDAGDLYIRDDSGMELLEESLAIPFLAYVDRRFGPYLIERMEELIRFGFSINDNMAQFFYQTRFAQ